ncbi:GNAT family N-acetyltransferase [Vibrio intestinalis]|uniref:GNAT family N-acetyltransferase n=1 Tax=Vibrio intestinalis TaxID=2933291 RepID=UPI0021A30E22
MTHYSISDDADRIDFDTVHQFLSNSYWAKGIPAQTLRRGLSHSLCFGVYENHTNQVGFARVISDFATYAYILDVFILEPHRGQGVGKDLIATILKHPDLQGIRRISLGTKDAHGLYAQYGFKPIDSPENVMQIWQPDLYLNS